MKTINIIFFFLNNTLACNLFRHLRCKNKYKDVAETNVRILAKYAVFLFYIYIDVFKIINYCAMNILSIFVAK